MGGGDVGAAFAATLRQIGTALAPEDLAALYPSPGADAAQRAVPTTLEECKFFDLFDADPAEVNMKMEIAREKATEKYGTQNVTRTLRGKRHHPLKKSRQFDFRLQPEEKARLETTGLVVSQRLQAKSFAEIYYRLYTDDMPVLITADSVLHAWHRSFDAFLVDLEERELAPALTKILETTLSKCHDAIPSACNSGPSSTKALLDVELFLSIGLGLLKGELPRDSASENRGQMRALWDAIKAEQTMLVELFSASRDVDFSQFKPRGHYTKSAGLGRYFRAMIWLGTIDLRIAGGEEPKENLHQLHCAVVLVHLLRESGNLEAVAGMDAAISRLIADDDMGADSLTPKQLLGVLPPESGSLLGSVGRTPKSFDEEQQKMLLELQERIVQRGLGAQLISGHPHVEALLSESDEPTVLPTSFALLGQRFVWSSFIFSRLVYDQVLHQGIKQTRRIPSAVDVAFALFGNDVAGGEIADRMRAPPEYAASTDDLSEFVPFRDGIPFASNLVALRQVIDQAFDDDGSKEATAADEGASVSTLWLRALRALSRASPNGANAFHSDTWRRRQMNTQIASFTQLRHDSVLYSKQSYTIGTRCEYADGMVDPYPIFWSRMRELAEQTARIAGESLPALLGSSSSLLPSKAEGFFSQFAATMQSLEAIAVSQAESAPLSETQVNFVKTVMEERFGSGGSRYCGWYPRLFYKHPKDSGKRDVLVVDVHTDVPSIEHGDPGGVLHLGVGDPLTGFFIVNNVMYAGPVFSSYEFVTPVDERWTDDEFQEKLPALSAPQWARQSYLG
ncbi:hypothetical protein BBJ28_00006820 [Nothophytophthora sp. Chile5]|nr:hypothetical protein BBJ28_00006820 [Nothophytophthora sp. Chile5]